MSASRNQQARLSQGLGPFMDLEPRRIKSTHPHNSWAGSDTKCTGSSWRKVTGKIVTVMLCRTPASGDLSVPVASLLRTQQGPSP